MEIPQRSWIVTPAWIFAFLLAVVGVWRALVAGPILTLPLALVPFMAGLGIWRKQAWGAYGFALYTLSIVVGEAIILLEHPQGMASIADAVVAFPFVAGVGLLYLATGRRLAQSGIAGRKLPWMIISALRLLVAVAVVPTTTMGSNPFADRTLALRFALSKPTVGELVMFFCPPDGSAIFRERVVGVPGDHIRISKNVLYRNGIAIQESYAIHRNVTAHDFPPTNLAGVPVAYNYKTGKAMLKNNVVDGAVVVPEDSYFVLGDNRDWSFDSRYFGFIRTTDLIGKPFLIYDSQVPRYGFDDDVNLGIDLFRYLRRVRWERLLTIPD